MWDEAVTTPMELTRDQILAFRQRVGSLGERLPYSPASLRRAAWAGLTDSVPRAALLSIHARVDGATPNSWEDDALVQVWGPRFSAYVVAAEDRAVFTLGRLRASGPRRELADDLAARLRTSVGDRRMPYGEAGRMLGVHHNQLRYAAPTGTVLIRWEGARQPHIWTVPPPAMDEQDARRELARRHLHILGPSTPEAYGKWAGIKPAPAQAVFDDLRASLLEVRTPIGDAFILADDEDAFRQTPEPAAAARLLPSGDAYYLCWGADRDLLVPEPERRDALWTSRVWPGAVMVEGEIVGTWRRSQHKVTVQPWRRLARKAVQAVEAEAASLPLPDLDKQITVTWEEP
jgi:hypothetical protein